MAVPVLTTEVMFNDPTWTDISAYVRGATVKRGSSRVDSPILRYEAGTAQIRLDNRDRRFDPTNLDGPYVSGGSPGTTGEYQFKCTVPQFFGYGLTINVGSAVGNVASVVNVRSRASGTTGSFNLPKPDGTLSGHKMILIHFSDIGQVSDMSVSGGATWNSLGTATSGNDTIQVRVWHKTAGGSEPTNYAMTQNSGTDGVAIVITLRNANVATTPVLTFTNNDGQSLFSTPGNVPISSNDIEIRACGGSPYGTPGASWISNDPMDGFTEYADRQSNEYTTAAVFIKSLSGIPVGTGTDTRVLPMRPIRLRATWNFVASTNLVQNPSFELGTTGWQEGTGNGSIRTVDQFGFIGGDSLELSRQQTSPGLFIYSALCTGVGSGGATSGQTVTISAYVYVPAASFSKVTSYMIAATGFANTFVTGPPGADQWFRVSATKVLTGTLDDIQFQFWTDDTHGDGQVIAYVDGVQAEVRSSASPYCDGDQPGCTWTGTAHGSNSSRPSSVTFPVFRGFVDTWGVGWTADVDSEVTVECTDGFKVMGAKNRAALGSPVGANELSGARITRILDSVSWPIADRNIATGIGQMQGTTLDGSGLTELFLVADSEIGEFYVDAAGIATFRGRTGIFSDTRSTNPQARFGDGGVAAGEVMYHDVVISYDDVQLYNEARIARTNGSQQEAIDQDSIDEFLAHTFERTDLLLVSDAESLSYAQWIIYISKDPELRFDQLIIRPQKDEDNLFPQILTRQIGDRIRITRRPPDNTKPTGQGTPVIREVFIRGMELTIEQYFWEMTYNLQSATKVGSFLTLDHPVLGRIGKNALRF